MLSLVVESELPWANFCMQVYGDAVMDEAPLLILTNYHVTVFLKRSEHVHDKRLWASEPVWWNQQHPSARSCWLRALQVAEEMQHIKCKLRRMVVPQTAEGYIIPVSSKQAQQPLAKKLRPQAQPAIRLMASSDTLKGYEHVTKGVTQDAAPANTEHHSAGILILALGLFTMLVSQHLARGCWTYPLARPASVRITS